MKNNVKNYIKEKCSIWNSSETPKQTRVINTFVTNKVDQTNQTIKHLMN